MNTQNIERQIARLRYLKMAPRKVRSVASLLKGLRADEAEAQLLSQRRRASAPILKLLRSAVAGAKNNKRLNADNLYIENLFVDGGPMLKRSLPRARGMATPIQKKMSHVTIILREARIPKQPRFKIVVAKKTKLPPKEKKQPATKEKMQKEQPSVSEPKRPGFFKKIFNRKSGFAK